jgi:hypothetical protein
LVEDAAMSAFDPKRTFVALLQFTGQRLTKMLTVNCAKSARRRLLRGYISIR